MGDTDIQGRPGGMMADLAFLTHPKFYASQQGRQIMATAFKRPTAYPTLTIAEIDRVKTPACGVFTITPEFAAEVLANRNDRNRHKKAALIGRLRKDMADNRFNLNGESVVFSAYGNLLDGQHRLEACWQSGKSFEAVVALGIEEQALATIDQSMARTTGDIISIQGDFPKAVAETAACVGRYMAGFHRGHRLTFGRVTEISRDVALAEIHQNPTIVAAAEWAIALRKDMRGVTVPSMIALARVVLEECYPGREEDVLYFLERVAIGDDIRPEQPAFTTRARLSAATRRLSIPVAQEILLRGAKAHMEGRDLKKIHVNNSLPELG